MNASKVYGQPNPSFEATYAVFMGTDTPAVLGGTLVFDTTATDNSPAGSYVVTPRGFSSTNYVLEYAPGTLTIARAATTVALTSSMSSPEVHTVSGEVPLERTSVRLSPKLPASSDAAVVVDVIVSSTGSAPTHLLTAVYTGSEIMPVRARKSS